MRYAVTRRASSRPRTDARVTGPFAIFRSLCYFPRRAPTCIIVTVAYLGTLVCCNRASVTTLTSVHRWDGRKVNVSGTVRGGANATSGHPRMHPRRSAAAGSSPEDRAARHRAPPYAPFLVYNLLENRRSFSFHTTMRCKVAALDGSQSMTRSRTYR